MLVFNIYFDYGSMGRLGDIKVSFVDSKTIFFQTPPCQILSTGQNLIVPIIVTQNDFIIARVDFVYLTRELFQFLGEIKNYFSIILATKSTGNLCSPFQYDMNNNISNKRRHLILDCTESDGGESLVQQMSRLTVEVRDE
jgi:hypothetical protein